MFSFLKLITIYH